jgi:hypothetical protein
VANSKISALTSATTPLAGTETLPVVQSSATTKVTVSNLTAGRAVSALSFASTSGFNFNSAFTSTNNYVGCDNTAGNSATLWFRAGRNVGAGSVDAVGLDCLNSAGSVIVPAIIRATPFYINDGTATTTYSGGNITVGAGNIVPNTAAKGINFTANTPASGMTSQLLNWYEEGSFSPTITAAVGTGYTTAVYFAKYTRVGRLVTIALNIQVTAAGTASGVMNISGLPFTSAATMIPASICYEQVSGIAYLAKGSAAGTTATITTLTGTGIVWAYATQYNFTLVYQTT